MEMRRIIIQLGDEESNQREILYYTILYYTILYYTILYYTRNFELRRKSAKQTSSPSPMGNISLADLVARWRAISGGQDADWFWDQVDLDDISRGADPLLPILTWAGYPLRELYRISFYPGFKNPFIRATGRDSELIVEYVISNGFLSEDQMYRFLPQAVLGRQLALVEAESVLEPYSLLPFQIFHFFFSFTNSSLFTLLTLSLVVLLLIWLFSKKGILKSIRKKHSMSLKSLIIRYFWVFLLHSLTTRNNHQRLVQHLLFGAFF
jgi:hypothetical protein